MLGFVTSTQPTTTKIDSVFIYILDTQLKAFVNPDLSYCTNEEFEVLIAQAASRQ
jgi:hypothetical protein